MSYIHSLYNHHDYLILNIPPPEPPLPCQEPYTTYPFPGLGNSESILCLYQSSYFHGEAELMDREWLPRHTASSYNSELGMNSSVISSLERHYAFCHMQVTQNCFSPSFWHI